MFTTTTATDITTATNKKTRTKRSLRTLALAGVMAIAASACSIGGNAVDTETAKAPTTTIEQKDVTQNENTDNENTQNENTDNDSADNEDADTDRETDGETDRDADERDDDRQPPAAPTPDPVQPPSAPEPEPAYVVGACDVVDYPALDTYVAYADAELRTEPVIGTPVEVIFAGEIAYPAFTEFDCAVGDDGTVWWFIGTEFGVEAWVNAAWLDPIDLNEALDYTVAELYFVAIDCFEIGVEAACDEVFSRNDGTADRIGADFVNAYMAGDSAALDALSIPELSGSWFDLLPTEDVAGDGFGAESLSITGNTISFVPFPTGSVSCYADAGVIAYCSFGE